MTVEQIGTGSKKGRGRAKKSLDLIDTMNRIAEAAEPITGRGVGYKLFTMGLIPSMTKPDMQSVYRLLKEAREESIIPWEWIVDETRELEREPSWSDPAEFVRTVSRAYRRDFWKQQPVRVEMWSEKGTVRGVLLVPSVRQKEGPPSRLVRAPFRRPMLGIGRDGPKRPARVCRKGNQGRD